MKIQFLWKRIQNQANKLWIRKTFDRLLKDHKNMEEYIGKPPIKCMTIGKTEVRPIGQLLPFKKPPLEPYFEGLKKKQVLKKKIKKSNLKNSNDVISETPPAGVNEGWFAYLTGSLPEEKKRNAVEENLQKKKLQVVIQSYEALKERQKLNSSARQRQSERTYLEQQENLIETWSAVRKRREQVRKSNSEDFMSQSSPFGGRRKVRSDIKIFLLPKKFWNDGEENDTVPNTNEIEDKKEETNTETFQLYSILDMEDNFRSKLVFDDCDVKNPPKSNIQYKL